MKNTKLRRNLVLKRFTGTLAVLTAGLLFLAGVFTACSDDGGSSGTEKVTVSYQTEFGSQPVEVKVEKGKELTSDYLPDLSFGGYEFSGWFITSGEEEIKVEPGYKVNGNITLTAKWKKLSYFITYVSEQGEYSKSVTVEENTVIDASYLAAPNLTIEGYEFTGWYIGDTKVEAGTVTVGEAGVVLTAKWQLIKVKITWLSDFGEAPEAITVDWGTALEDSHLKSIKGVTSAKFDGWYIGEEKAAAGMILKEDTVLTAKWTVNGYTVVYRTEHGTPPESLIKQTGDVLTADELPILTADGFEFFAWYIGDDIAEAGKVTVGKENIVLEAFWKPIKCTLSYTTTIGTAPTPKTVNWGTLLDSTTLPVLTADGCTFTGWFFNGDKVEEGFKLTDSITLTANWEKMKCKITYKSAHGTDIPGEATVEYGNPIPSELLPELSDEKWEFKGWYVKSADGNNTKVEPGLYTVLSHVELTAEWKCREQENYVYVDLESSAPLYFNCDEQWDYESNHYVYTFTSYEGFNSFEWHIDNVKQECYSDTFTINGADFAEGNYTITLYAKDAEGNSKSYNQIKYIQ